MAIQTEKFNIIIDQFDGMQTSRDSDDIGDSKSPILLNGRITGSHFRGAKGYSLSGSRNNNAGEISSQFTYNRNDGKQVMVRVKDNASTGTLQWYDAVNDAFYTLLASLTTGKVMGFAEFNTSTANNLIFCNGVENLSTWTGATTRLTSAVTATDTTINVSDTSDFPATGTIIYNGTEIAYSAKTATTFTVASAHASAGANDGVAEAVDDTTHSAITKGNILLSAKDRLWIAGQPTAPGALDYSDEGDFSTFTGGANRSDSGTEDFFNIGGSITGLAEKGEEIIVLGEDGGDGFSFTYPTDTTKAPIFREIFRAPGQGCLSPRSVFKLNNEVFFANRNGIAALSDLEGTEKVFKKSVTRDILPTLLDYDFSESASIFHEKESILLVSAKSDKTYPGNDVVIGVEFYTRKDGVDTIGITMFDWSVNAWAILNNSDNVPELFFGSSLEQNSFKAFDTYQNDGSPRNIKYSSKRFNFKSPFQAKSCGIAAIRGYIKDGTDIDVQVLYDAGFKSTMSKTIESTGTYVSQNTLNTIGAFELGVNPIGANLEEVGELKEFLVYLDIGKEADFKDIQFICSSETDGGTFIITHIGMAVEMTGVAKNDTNTI
jgi:hypothetical protein